LDLEHDRELRSWIRTGEAAESRVLRGPPLLALRGMWSKSLTRNSIFIMMATALTLGLGYIYWIAAARDYTPAEVGLGSALISTMTAASVLSSFGLHTSMVQILPRADAERFTRTINGALTAAVCVGTAAGVAVVSVLPLVVPTFRLLWDEPLMSVALVLGVVLWTTSNVLDYVATAERAAGNLMARNASFAVLKIPLLMTPVAVHGGANGIFLSWLLAVVISLGVPIMMLRRRPHRYLGLRLGTRASITEVLRVGTSHHLLNLGNLTPMFVLPIIVVGQLNATQNAYFYATWMTGVVFFMVSASVSQSLFAEGSHRPRDLKAQTRSSALFTAGLLIPLSLIFIVGRFTILSAFGARYASAGATLLLILTLSAFPDAVTNIYVAVLRVIHRFFLGTVISAGSAAVTIVLSWILLPSLGIVGVGWAWLAAQLFGCLVVVLDVVLVGLPWRPSRRRYTHAPLDGAQERFVLRREGDPQG
jgi:O-antigen/teichoic acid export membrane protein